MSASLALLLLDRGALASNIAAQIEQLRGMDGEITAAVAANPAVKASAVIAEIDTQDDLIITALTGLEDPLKVKEGLHPLREAKSEAFRLGETKGAADSWAGLYVLSLNPYPIGTKERDDWQLGYVGAWDSTYFAKKKAKEVARG
ncbi:MAG TPA: hypothetical protein VK961_06855 [Chthoniobacter sp.]|nr:hypothetical protein [Chthoniobacter sp.]